MSLPSWQNITSQASERDEHSSLQVRLSEIPPHILALSAFVLGSAATLAATSVRARYFQRFPSSEWVPPRALAKKRWMKGVVTSVGDADNFRLYHTPGWFWSWPLKLRRIPSTTKDLKDQTLHIRMAGVDAPEAAHFGRPAQEFSSEALLWLKEQVEGKAMYCQIIRRDQYFRLVSIPMLPRRWLPKFTTPITGRCVSIDMLRAGWATTYEQSGAEYGKWGKETFLEAEAEAKASRRGMWKHGVSAETPAEYKRRYAAPEVNLAAGSSSKPLDTSPKRKT
ncbi:staphylococcal nuclease [Rickenella mellea]|uniref:Staphylococcal nuclease n=1 Tax=Rickenella mellea TaxID=50990 RepID=A0A4Y7PNK5_9AGAM|nr:staphylococcal nuclease [Rickenella mellea]